MPPLGSQTTYIPYDHRGYYKPAGGEGFLLHFDGTDGSQIFTDVKGHTFTVLLGTPTISTLDPRFGTGRGRFPTGRHLIESPDDADFEIGSRDWNVQYFQRWAVADGNSGIVSKGEGSAWITYFDASRLVININLGVRLTSAPQALLANTWYHVCCSRGGGTLYAFIDGIMIASAVTAVDVPNNADPVYIGTDNLAVPASAGDVFLDELRLQIGTAITANFTPPIAPFTS